MQQWVQVGAVSRLYPSGVMLPKSAKADVTQGVYRLWFSENHYYIGRSSNIENRCRQHLQDLRRGKHINPHMAAVFAKYGGSFRFEIVAVAAPEEASILEQSLIDSHLGNHYCLNICPSSSFPTRKGKKNTPEHCAKISQARQGIQFSEEAHANMAKAQKQRFAKGWTPELRAAMEAAGKRPEVRERRSGAQKGKKLSQETKTKIGDSIRGRTVGEETRKKLSQLHRGKTVSEETRKKLSDAIRGRILSESTRIKMSEAQKRRQERERSDRMEESEL